MGALAALEPLLQRQQRSLQPPLGKCFGLTHRLPHQGRQHGEADEQRAQKTKIHLRNVRCVTKGRESWKAVLFLKHSYK